MRKGKVLTMEKELRKYINSLPETVTNKSELENQFRFNWLVEHKENAELEKIVTKKLRKMQNKARKAEELKAFSENKVTKELTIESSEEINRLSEMCLGVEDLSISEKVFYPKMGSNTFFTADFETTSWNKIDAQNGKALSAILLCIIQYEQDSDGIRELQRWAFVTNFTKSFISLFEQHYEYYHEKMLVYFHNTDFDVNFLRMGLIKHGYKLTDHSNGKNLETCIKKDVEERRVSEKTGKVLKGKRKEANKCVVRNSLALLPSSIKQIGKSVKLPKLNFDTTRPESEYSHEEIVEYCFRDCEIIAYGLQLLCTVYNTIAKNYYREDNTDIISELSKCNEEIQVISLPITLSSLSLMLFKVVTNEMYFVTYDENLRPRLRHTMFSFKNREAINKHWREHYRGGFSNCFTREIFDSVICMDANSLYPSVMAYNKFPVGNYECSEFTDLADLPDMLNHEKFYAYDVTVDDTFMYPFVPVKEEDGIVRYRACTKRCVLFREEINEILKFKQDFVKEVHKVYICNYQKSIFDYMEPLYELRHAFKLKGQMGFDYIIKILLNATYGKFGMRTMREDFDLVPSSRELLEELYKEGIPFNLSDDGKFITISKKRDMAMVCEVNVMIAAKVTALGRLRLIGTMNTLDNHGVQCINGDTDSIMVKEEDYERIKVESIIPLDENKLGLFKKDHTYKLFMAIAPKEYKYLELDGKVWKEGQKSKGVKTDSDLLKYYTEGVEIVRPMKFKESLHSQSEILENLKKNGQSYDHFFTQQRLTLKKKGKCYSSRKFNESMYSSKPLTDKDEIIDERDKILQRIEEYINVREIFYTQIDSGKWEMASCEIT